MNSRLLRLGWQVMRLVSHLTWWGEGKIILPVSAVNVYLLAPTLSAEQLTSAAFAEFATTFSPLRLSSVLVCLAGELR